MRSLSNPENGVIFAVATCVQNTCKLVAQSQSHNVM